MAIPMVGGLPVLDEAVVCWQWWWVVFIGRWCVVEGGFLMNYQAMSCKIDGLLMMI